jgi:hypothetical protein
MTYCSDFICTYKLHEDDITDELYQAQLLQAFNLNNWNYKKMNVLMKDVYNLIKLDIIHIIEYIQKSNNKHFNIIKMFPIDDIENACFEMLFAYDYFDLIHKCICEKINDNKISSNSINNLFNKIKCE